MGYGKGKRRAPFTVRAKDRGGEEESLGVGKVNSTTGQRKTAAGGRINLEIPNNTARCTANTGYVGSPKSSKWALGGGNAKGNRLFTPPVTERSVLNTRVLIQEGRGERVPTKLVEKCLQAPRREVGTRETPKGGI